MQGKRTLQKDATRKHIIDIAFNVYAERGFATPTSVISKEAGVSHGALFAHFATREALINHLLERFDSEICAKLHDLSASGGDMVALLHAHLDVLEQYEGFYTRLISEIQMLPSEARYTLIAIQSVVSLHFSAAMQRGAQSGALKRIPVHMLLNTWLGLVHYYLQNGDLFAPGASVIRRYKDELIDSFTALITQ